MLYRIVKSSLTINNVVYSEGSVIDLDDKLGLDEYLVPLENSPDIDMPAASIPKLKAGNIKINHKKIKG